MFRIGNGWDRHRLVPGRKCILGGIDFADCPVGPLGHSDGDAVCHAISDSLLGAASLGDIGSHFPDTDPSWVDADSLQLLERVRTLVGGQGFSIANTDVTIITEEPKIAPRVSEMQEVLARTLQVEPDQVSIKATRGEGMGPEGRGECITVQAIALLEKK